MRHESGCDGMVERHGWLLVMGYEWTKKSPEDCSTGPTDMTEAYDLLSSTSNSPLHDSLASLNNSL